MPYGLLLKNSSCTLCKNYKIYWKMPLTVTLNVVKTASLTPAGSHLRGQVRWNVSNVRAIIYLLPKASNPSFLNTSAINCRYTLLLTQPLTMIPPTFATHLHYNEDAKQRSHQNCQVILQAQFRLDLSLLWLVMVKKRLSLWFLNTWVQLRNMVQIQQHFVLNRTFWTNRQSSL